jgi:16S rRNA (adenine1518-N6/adenine1519-N6)-dimethyltransferase
MNTRRSRSLGQNFLTNDYISERIAASIPEEALRYLFEIGPGKGILTEKLLLRGGKVRAVELDERMRPYLSPLIKTYGQDIDIIWGNAIDSVGTMFLQPTFLVSNLPFNISTELFYGLCEGLPFSDLIMTPFLGGIVMVQEEFGRRLLNGPGSKDYGKLSILFQSKMDAHPLFRVKRGNFDPVPNVDALVISFGPKRNGVRIPKDETMFKKVLLASFSSRRKKLRNSLHPGDLGIRSDMNAIRGLLQRLDIDDLRPEELSVDRFLDISDGLTGL